MQATCTVHPYPARWRVSFTPRREETSSKLDRQLNICSKHFRLSPNSTPPAPTPSLPSRRAAEPFTPMESGETTASRDS